MVFSKQKKNEIPPSQLPLVLTPSCSLSAVTTEGKRRKQPATFNIENFADVNIHQCGYFPNFIDVEDFKDKGSGLYTI